MDKVIKVMARIADFLESDIDTTSIRVNFPDATKIFFICDKNSYYIQLYKFPTIEELKDVQVVE